MRTEFDRVGLSAGLFAYVVWGFLPILFLAAERIGASPAEVVAWRTLWSVPCAALLVLFTGDAKQLRALRPRALLALLLSATFISINWLVYVYAVESHQTLTASLGYFINPLLNMAAGAIIFHERLGRSQIAAILLAGFGVALQGVALGALPWLPLVLAVSFCGYGVVRKRIAVSAQSGLLVECLILSVSAAAAIAVLLARHQSVFGHGLASTALLVACGPATVIPLAAFTVAARRLPLTVIGFLQFLAPTLQFAVGVASGERLTHLRLLSFGFIWAGVAIFAAASLRQSRPAGNRPASNRPAGNRPASDRATSASVT